MIDVHTQDTALNLRPGPLICCVILIHPLTLLSFIWKDNRILASSHWKAMMRVLENTPSTENHPILRFSCIWHIHWKGRCGQKEGPRCNWLGHVVHYLHFKASKRNKVSAIFSSPSSKPQVSEWGTWALWILRTNCPSWPSLLSEQHLFKPSECEMKEKCLKWARFPQLKQNRESKQLSRQFKERQVRVSGHSSQIGN